MEEGSLEARSEYEAGKSDVTYLVARQNPMALFFRLGWKIASKLICAYFVFEKG
jgi:hypothetical protein